MTNYDCAVVGLGAAGSAALSALARMGVRAVGVDQFNPPHAFGSSHGETRLLRTAYSEGAAYVPMAQRSILLWRELERRTATTLFRQTGVRYFGPRDDAFLASARDAAAQFHLALTEGIADTGFALPAGWQRFEERDGGFLFPEPAIAALLDDARAHGAAVIANCACDRLELGGSTIALSTSGGPIQAEHVIIAAGGWSAALIPELAARTHVERRVLHWFEDRDGQHRAEAGFKPFVVTTDEGAMFYGFPANDAGEVKVAEHFEGTPLASPALVDYATGERDAALIEPFVRRYMPGLGKRTRSTVCFYPMSWDGHFILDRHPSDHRIVIGAGLSGHGFKFAPVIGEALADLAMDREQQIDAGFFALSR